MMISLDIVRRVLSWITDHFIRRRQQEVIHFKTVWSGTGSIASHSLRLVVPVCQNEVEITKINHRYVCIRHGILDYGSYMYMGFLFHGV